MLLKGGPKAIKLNVYRFITELIQTNSQQRLICVDIWTSIQMIEHWKHENNKKKRIVFKSTLLGHFIISMDLHRRSFNFDIFRNEIQLELFESVNLLKWLHRICLFHKFALSFVKWRCDTNARLKALFVPGLKFVIHFNAN